MADSVPPELIVLLERLGLADEGAIRAVEGRVRRLGRDLPQFQPIWVDALAETRLLSPYQAAEINAGRGDDLRLGPYVVKAKRSSLGYARRFAARHVESGDEADVIVIEGRDGEQDNKATDLLADLTMRASELTAEGLAPLTECGHEGRRVWAAIRTYPGTTSNASHGRERNESSRAAASAPGSRSGQTAREHLVRHGRMPPDVVLEIARQMVAAMQHLQRAGLAHGDVSTTTLVLTKRGRAVLLAPGLRPVCRPAEGFAHIDLAPEYYDSLTPEQIDGGQAADAATDLYGCGCVWWHLLTGRACFAGGDSLGKLRAHLTQDTTDVRQLAPDAPADLAAVIESCLARDRARRPASAADLAKRLGPSTPAGRSEVARWCKPSGGSAPIHVPSSRRRTPQRTAWPTLAVVAALVGFVALLWAIGLPSRSARDPQTVVAHQPAAKPESSNQETQKTEPANQQPDQPLPLPAEGRHEVVLASDGPVTLDPSKLVDGARVAASPGSRATVLVRGSPITVTKEDVLFDGIDFVWHAGAVPRPGGEASAILRVEAGRIRFRRCTFQTATGQSGSCAALQWVFPVERSGLTLPAGKLALDDCVFSRVDAAIDARTAAALTIECDNVLHLGPGPFLQLNHAPPVDEPIGLTLKNVTLRQAGPVLEIHDQAAVDKPGTISVSAQLCIFEPRAHVALLSFIGSNAPTALAKAVYWTGEGALVTPDAGIAQWRDSSGRVSELNDAAFSIAGLVRSRVEFAGAAEPEIASNVARRWQAPLPTDEAPGIRAGALPQPVQ